MSTIDTYTQKIKEGVNLAFNCAEEMQAHDIGHYPSKEPDSDTSDVILLTIQSPRQMRAVSEEIKDSLKKIGLPLHHEEGDRNSGWVLLDYGDLIIHMFAKEFREFYDLESLLGPHLKFIL